jgi:hypothetical protein
MVIKENLKRCSQEATEKAHWRLSTRAIQFTPETPCEESSRFFILFEPSFETLTRAAAQHRVVDMVKHKSGRFQISADPAP